MRDERKGKFVEGVNATREGLVEERGVVMEKRNGYRDLILNRKDKEKIMLDMIA